MAIAATRLPLMHMAEPRFALLINLYPVIESALPDMISPVQQALSSVEQKKRIGAQGSTASTTSKLKT